MRVERLVVLMTTCTLRLLPMQTWEDPGHKDSALDAAVSWLISLLHHWSACFFKRLPRFCTFWLVCLRQRQRACCAARTSVQHGPVYGKDNSKEWQQQKVANIPAIQPFITIVHEQGDNDPVDVVEIGSSAHRQGGVYKVNNGSG